MSNDELVLRQQRLLMRSAQLRIVFVDQVQVAKKPLALADYARTRLQWLRLNPQWPLGALLVILILRPRRAVVWGGRLWWVWTTFNRAQNWVKTRPLP